MMRLIKPLEVKTDFDNLTDLLSKCLDNNEYFRFLSYSLIKFDKETIENLTKNHKENGIDYIVHETNDLFSGVLAFKKNKFTGFELFLLVVDKDATGRSTNNNELIEIGKELSKFIVHINKTEL